MIELIIGRRFSMQFLLGWLPKDFAEMMQMPMIEQHWKNTLLDSLKWE